ncbi:hypothetical protein HYU17_05285 [Candidatus Woesearchaeota archaeon]|nr:hypothetical protein [Candidatus Woesearchaeota archaeon]
MIKPLYTPKREPMRIAALMSGKGTNLRKILERQLSGAPFKVVAIFTDNKESDAGKIAAEYKIPLMSNDIKEYCTKMNVERKELGARKAYDSETRKFFEKHNAEVAALCGYLSIVTGEIADNFVTVNIHPADLRKRGKNGKRQYAGMLGLASVKAAIINGDKELRSTVHLVTRQVDEGPIMMVSEPVKAKITMDERKNPELLNAAAERNMAELKEKGDWAIFPEAIEMMAMGRFAADEKGAVYLDGKPIPEGCEPG